MYMYMYNESMNFFFKNESTLDSCLDFRQIGIEPQPLAFAR